MIPPHRHFFAEKLPQQPAKKNVFLIHMHENGIVIFTLAPDEVIEIEHVSQARDAALFAERQNFYIFRQVVFSFGKADHGYFFAMFCKFLNPPVEKTQDWIVPVYFLGNN